MKQFFRQLLSKRKTILIFLIAIFLPSLVVGYLSLSTITKRRQTLKSFIDSNLLISGEAALKSLETEMLRYEKEALNLENFKDIAVRSSSAKGIRGKLFLLDDTFQIIHPTTRGVVPSVSEWEEDIPDTELAQLFREAESLEFSQKKYDEAAEAYKKIVRLTPSKHLQALALEGLGRCLLYLKKQAEAYKVYGDLATKFEQFKNRAGHPFGLAAVFELHSLAQKLNKEKDGLETLITTYKKLRDGAFLISTEIYDFFRIEIESTIQNTLKRGKHPETQKFFENLQAEPSSFRQALDFVIFLNEKTVPRIQERFSLTHISDESSPERLLLSSEKELNLVSFKALPNFHAKKTYIGGFVWDVTALKNTIIPDFLKDITKDSGLNIQITDESGRSILPGRGEFTSTNFITFSFRELPFPWKFSVSQQELRALEKSARREILLYGALLVVIVALMLLGAVLIMRDIYRDAETTRLKTEFVHNVSHELKTPLTLIRLYGETLQQKTSLPKDEKHEAYEIITKESERLSHMINNVLDFSRIEMGRKEFTFKRGNLAQVIQDTLESYRYHLEKKGFVIHSNIASALVETTFDGEALASVLVNLLSNAMKFSPKTKDVYVKLFEEKGNVVLQVRDKGIGISPKDASKIFQRFYRSKNKATSETGGSGLGLTLVKHIVEAHGGRIIVESEPGKGSTFSVILPVSGPIK